MAQYRDSNHWTALEALLDGYGRMSRQAMGEGPNIWYQYDTCYDQNGNISFQSYKYQSAWGTATVCSGAGDAYSYDALGRVTLVKHGDGTQISYQYVGRATKVTDENGAARITQTDAFGRTTLVCELSSSTLIGDAPGDCGTDIPGTGFVTSYSYDQPNHKTTVTQGAQTRAFQTDWLGRTVYTFEPERGVTSYSYNYNGTGLQVTRTRPRANQPDRGVTTDTTTQYDTMGRPVQTTYSDGTPERDLTYDVSVNWGQGQSNLKGRLSRIYTPVLGNWAAAIWSYDAMGRVTVSDQCFPNGCGNAANDRISLAAYDWRGNLIRSTDITNNNVSYNFTDAGEVTDFSRDVANGQIMSNAQNGPNGPLSYTLGNGLGEAITYDGMGRLNGKWLCKGGAPGAFCPNTTQIYGMTASWSGSRLTDNCDTVMNTCRSFSYDEFNRLTGASVRAGAAQNFTYSYDRYGNRWSQTVTAGSGSQASVSYDKTTNRIQGYGYDAAGNLTSDGAHSYTYDAEGNVTAVDRGQMANYTYDALNRRFRVQTTKDTVDYEFDALGRRVVVWREAANVGIRGNMYWGGMPFAFIADDTYYQQQDWLGTERVRTNSAGNFTATYFSLPFGDGFAPSPNGRDDDPDHFAFTERDNESLTDHALFRQYSESTGRWMSPDPYDRSYDFTNPQSLNRYSYVLNNPLSGNDPSGLDRCADKTASGDDTCNSNDGGGGPIDIGPGQGGSSHVYGDPPGTPSSCGLGCIPIYYGPIGGGATGGPGPGPGPAPQLPTPAPNKPGCSTVLPNGKTLGQYINQGRAQMQASKAPLLTFASIARDYGQIDFKNGAGGRSVLATNLGQDGNFAYYAIGSGFLPPNMLDFGASVYAVAATVPYPGHSGKPFSTIGNGPMLIDDSAASMRSAGLATPGCPP